MCDEGRFSSERRYISSLLTRMVHSSFFATILRHCEKKELFVYDHSLFPGLI